VTPELRALVYQAWELRGTPYLIDAVRAIVDWQERKPLAEFELQQERDARNARLILLLRETDPYRLRAIRPLDEAA
jgi:hypothetical protein